MDACNTGGQEICIEFPQQHPAISSSREFLQETKNLAEFSEKSWARFPQRSQSTEMPGLLQKHLSQRSPSSFSASRGTPWQARRGNCARCPLREYRGLLCQAVTTPWQAPPCSRNRLYLPARHPPAVSFAALLAPCVDHCTPRSSRRVV